MTATFAATRTADVSALPLEPACPSAQLRLASCHEAVRACYAILLRRSRSAAPLTRADALFACRCRISSQNPPSPRAAYAAQHQQLGRQDVMNSVARQRLDSCASEKLESLDLSGQDLDADAARELATMLPDWYANDRLLLVGCVAA